MKQILKKFLEENLIAERLNESFDYSFDITSSEENFYIEFKKFLGIYNSVFYYKNRLVTSFNSYEIRINIKDLNIIFKLYLYAKENNLIYYKDIIQDFLYTYFVTINTNEYKQNYDKYKESQTDFKKILNTFDIKKEFFNKFPDELYIFYRELIIYGLENKIFIDGEIIEKIFNNLIFSKKNINELVQLFIDKEENIHNIVMYDQEKEKHLDIYMKYIKESLNNYGGYNYAKEIIFQLDKNNCLNKENFDEIVNIYVKIINNLVNKLKNKQYSFIQGLSEMESLRKELLFLIKNIQNFEYSHKEKIKECLSRLLRLKRYVISDEDYVKAEMHKSKNTINIPKKEVESYRRTLLQNKFKLYSASRVNFHRELELALQLYSDYPLNSLVSRFTIDSERAVYLYGIGTRKYTKKDNFKNYYDKLGKEFTEKHPNLRNRLSSKFYEELLKHLATSFQLHQELLMSMFSRDELNSIIQQLKEEMGCKYNNDYAVVVSNILAIEVNIIKILKKNNISPSKEGKENLNNLFCLYENDSEKVNGLMYLNYILYEKSGLNLRNNATHGTLINESLMLPLMVTFSGLIFISWLLNEK